MFSCLYVLAFSLFYSLSLLGRLKNGNKLLARIRLERSDLNLHKFTIGQSEISEAMVYQKYRYLVATSALIIYILLTEPTAYCGVLERSNQLQLTCKIDRLSLFHYSWHIYITSNVYFKLSHLQYIIKIHIQISWSKWIQHFFLVCIDITLSSNE